MATSAVTLPIYEAVVCNLTLERMRQDEIEQGQETLLRLVLDCLAGSKQVAQMLTGGDFSKSSSQESITPIIVGLGVLVTTGRKAVEVTRHNLQHLSDKYRPTVEQALADFEANTDRLEEIAEGWCMTFDQDLLGEIKQALSASRNSEDSEIPDWRKLLATVQSHPEAEI